MAVSVVPMSARHAVKSEEPQNGAATLASALEFDILFGRLKPRERLVEDALMQRFGVKRHAVRQALVELAGRFTDVTMRKLNYQVDGEHRPVRDVAEQFLREAGLPR